MKLKPRLHPCIPVLGFIVLALFLVRYDLHQIETRYEVPDDLEVRRAQAAWEARLEQDKREDQEAQARADRAPLEVPSQFAVHYRPSLPRRTGYE